MKTGEKVFGEMKDRRMLRKVKGLSNNPNLNLSRKFQLLILHFLCY